MIVHLIVFFLISFIFLSFGLISIKAFEYLFKNKIKADYVNTTILGLIIVATLLRFLFILSPINSLVFIFIFVISLLISVLYRSDFISIIKSFFSAFASNKAYLLFFLVFTLYIGYRSSLTPNLYDIDLYHANLIRWIENFKIVPGLASLHWRLGLMGSWHILSALFSFSSISSFMVHALNGWLVWFFATYCLGGLIRVKKINSLVLANVFFVAFIFLTEIVIEYISSPGTDAPVIIFSWMVFMMLLSKRHSVKNKFLTDLNLIILPVFLITIKLSAISLPLISLLVLFSKHTHAHVKKIGLTIFTSIIFIQTLTTIALTGHLLFPVSQTALRFLDWTLPEHLVVTEREWIKSWAIRPRVDKDIVLQEGVISNIYYWHEGSSAFEKGVLISVYLLVTALIVKLLFFKIRHKHLSFIDPVVILTYVLGLFFWLLLAPDFRFGYGYIIVIIFMLLFTLFNLGDLSFGVSKKNKAMFLGVLGLLAIAGAISSSIKLSNKGISQGVDSLVFPMNYQERKVDEIFIDGLLFFVPDPDHEDNQTGYWGFPGTPGIRDSFYLLGQGYADGFAMME